MSFKIKKWGCRHAVSATDGYADFVTMSDENTSGLTFSWAGKVIFCGYDDAAAGAPIYLVYDPVARSWDGPHPGPTQSPYWMWHSGYTGNDRRYLTWGGQWMLALGLTLTGNAYSYFYGFNSACELVEWEAPAIPEGNSRSGAYYAAGIGSIGGQPARCVWQWYDDGVGTPQVNRVMSYGPWGYQQEAIANANPGPGLWLNYQVDVPAFSCTPMEGALLVGNYGLCSDPVTGEFNLYSAYPETAAAVCSEVVASIAASDAVLAAGGVAYFYVTERFLSDPDEHVWVAATAPTVEVSLPWTTWEYRMLAGGASHDLDEGDLDGVDHGASASIPVVSVSYGNGYYAGTDSTSAGTVVVYVLEPTQPLGTARKPASGGTDAIGYIGTYAIRPSLRVENILPVGYTPALTAAGMVERRDGALLTTFEAYKRQGRVVAHTGSIRIDATAYDWDDALFLWPGPNTDGFCPGFYDMFAEGPTGTVWARYPDETFGMWYNTGLGWVERGQGLGVLGLEKLSAAPGAASHVIQPLQRIAASIADFGPAPYGLVNVKKQLVGHPTAKGGPLLTYFGNCLRIQQEPWWTAVVGKFNGTTWTKLLDFSTIGPPGLGEDGGKTNRAGWTVWSLSYIKPCRPLPSGGWLVGATLYFAPWAESWEWDAGSRDATFRSTGLGYVPAIPGYDGPCLDHHEPVLLSALDEWTANRSLYGPDAMLVYDHQGNFVECLSNEDMYPADGREILVTNEAMPRIIYRVYREGTYSDYAEGWGAYHDVPSGEIHAGLYACYDLFGSRARIEPGAGTFRGFLDMYDVAPEGEDWRWTLAPGLYDALEPRGQWSLAGRGEMRLGKGGLVITPTSGPATSRNGVRGVGQRSGMQR